jgi:hypothetical protein
MAGSGAMLRTYIQIRHYRGVKIKKNRNRKTIAMIAAAEKKIPFFSSQNAVRCQNSKSLRTLQQLFGMYIFGNTGRIRSKQPNNAILLFGL